jgi:hypothetical protein
MQRFIDLSRKEEGPYYAGVTACEMTVDRSIRRGYKSLPEHVNLMDKSSSFLSMVTHTSQYGFPFGTSSLFGRNLMPFSTTLSAEAISHCRSM